MTPHLIHQDSDHARWLYARRMWQQALGMKDFAKADRWRRYLEHAGYTAQSRYASRSVFFESPQHNRRRLKEQREARNAMVIETAGSDFEKALSVMRNETLEEVMFMLRHTRIETPIDQSLFELMLVKLKDPTTP